MAKTLYIGLGGLGMRVVSELKKKQGDEDSFYLVFDCDIADMKENIMENEIDSIYCPHFRPKDYIEMCQGIKDWFPSTPLLLNVSSYETQGVRALGRLAFLSVLNDYRRLEVERFFGRVLVEKPYETALRIVIVTSLAGGLGSGLFISFAVWLRDFLKKSNFTNYAIDGFFVGSEMFADCFEFLRDDPERLLCMRANTYAALKELELISEVGKDAYLPSRKDDLFKNSEFYGLTSVYDRIYIFDDSLSCGSYDTVIGRIAEICRQSLPPIAGRISEEIQEFLSDSPELQRSYELVCGRLKDSYDSPLNPHLDKRWLGRFCE